MAKGQKRSSREAKKPKGSKKVAAAPPLPLQPRPAQPPPSKGQGR